MITAVEKRTQLLLILDNQSWLYFMGLDTIFMIQYSHCNYILSKSLVFDFHDHLA